MSEPMYIDCSFDDNNNLDVELSCYNERVGFELDTVIPVMPKVKYKDLEDKPSINGTTLEDNYDEIDPTVPEWAKQSKKPEYTAEEVGALSDGNEMSYSDIKAIWDSYFS